MKRRQILTVAAALGLLAMLIPAAGAQRRQPAGLQAATKAFLDGRYDEVATLTEKEAQDPAMAAVRAKAMIARGRYQEAESYLRPIVQKSPTSEAALELGLMLKMLGRDDADAVLTRVSSIANSATDPHDLVRAGKALAALREFQDANSLMREASRAAQNDAYVQTAWGDLFLDRSQNDEALTSYSDALKADESYQPALFGAAQALANDNPPQANQLANKALELNPQDTGVLLFLAGQALDNGKRDETRKLIQRALDVNPQSLDAHSVLAGLAYVEDKLPEFEAQVAKVLAIAPKHGEVYRVAGEMAASNYRFDEAAALVQRGLKLQPEDPKALSDLGVHLLRTGDEPAARTALEKSFDIDKFDRPTLNLLRMMDTLDKFITITEGDLIVRLHPDEEPVLREYVLSISRQALDTLQKRYNFKVTGPILIEVFPKHDDFAVRTVGLPGMVGALGACFGRVVTLDSPKAGPPGAFQWEATLWHELAHVITLQMSQQRIPRWLTEGISVYEEKLARPEWGRGQDMPFAQMLNSGELPKLKDLNAGFTNPRTISMSYFQASLLVEQLVAQYGDAGLQRLVRSYSKGIDTETALKQELNTDFDRLQVSFDAAMERKYGEMRRALAVPEKDVDLSKMPLEQLKPYAAERPRSYVAQLMLGNAARQAGDIDLAMQAFERAAGLVALGAGPSSPRAQMAAMALDKKDYPRATAELKALIAVDFDNVEAARQLARLYKQQNITDPATLYPVYFRIVAIDPFDAEAHVMLGRLALQRNEAEIAAREFRAVLALKPVDLASAHTDLAEAYFKGNKRPEARKQVLAALEIAPSYERAQDLLLNLSEAR